MLCNSCPKSIRSAIEGLILKKCDKNHISKIEVRLFLYWNNIVGDDISQVAKPKKLLFSGNSNTGILYLIVSNGGVAVNIQYSIPVIIEKISMFFGFKVVHGIRIIQQL